MTRPLEYALFVGGLLAAGLVVFALLWSGSGPYADLARDNGVNAVSFRVLRPENGTLFTDAQSAAYGPHARWSRYVTGGADQPPAFDPPLFSDDEYRHMADVKRVFDVARFCVPLGLFVIIVRLQRARARGSRDMWLMQRNGSLIAAGIVALIGVLAVVAFEPMFLLFHYVLFPQGNFLFDPATSNLVRLYPDWYWEGITLRVGLSFLALSLGLAGIAALRLRTAK